MGPDSQIILKTLNLRTNNPEKIDHAVLCNKRLYYLRYDEHNKSCNKVVNVDYLKNNYHKLVEQINKGILIQLSEYIDTIAGAVIYIQDDFIYGEFVLGEPVLILRRGLCKRRFYIDKRTRKYIDYPQTKSFFQSIGYIENTVDEEEIQKAYNKTIDACIDLFNNRVNGYIFEMHITPNDVIFTDAKYQDSWISHSSIEKLFHLEVGEKIAIKGEAIGTGECDRLDIDMDSFKESIYLKKGALLSHYVTYFNSEMINIVIER